MKVNRLSSLTRSIDLNYPTNRMIVNISLFFFLGVLILQFLLQKAFFPSLDSGFRAGMSVFLAWVFAREIDPDNEFSAFIGAFLGGIGFFFFPSPALLVLLLEILLIRMLNRSTGLPAKPSDSVIILLLSGWISVQYGFIFSLLTALVFFLDSFLPEANRQNRIFGVIASLLTLILAAFSFLTETGKGEIHLNTEFTKLNLFMLAAGVLFILKILNSRKIMSRGDLTGIPMNPVRVQTAQLIALLSAVIYAVLEEWEGFESFLPLWAAILGVSFYYLFIYLQGLLKKLLTASNPD